MPRFDGTGPWSQGPMTGRGEGYCALPIVRPGETRRGYVGLWGRPVGLGARFLRGPGLPWIGRRLGRAVWRGRGLGVGRGRGRRWSRW